LAIDEMLQTGKAALDHTPKVGGTRVLTEAQISEFRLKALKAFLSNVMYIV